MAEAVAAAAKPLEPSNTESRPSVAERRKNLLLGELPEDFLRLSVSPSGSAASGGGGGETAATGDDKAKQIATDEQAAMALQNQLVSGGAGATGYTASRVGYYSFVPPNTRGRLSITVVEAKLTKNYGLIRMDPYCRLRVGNTVFESPTNVGGGKFPKWNRTVHCYLPKGVDSVYLEIFDERAFSTDERVAWSNVAIPASVFNMETIDEWFPLSGLQGDAKEGMINLIFSFAPVGAPAVQYVPMYQPVVGAITPPTGDSPAHPPPAKSAGSGEAESQVADAEQAPTDPLYTDADVKELQEMFPNMADDVIRCVLDEKRGNKDAAVNALLLMSSD